MKTHRYNFILYARLVASILVVNLHLIGTTFLSFPYLDVKGRQVFDYLFDISHIAVPIFFIITGFIYLDKNKVCTYKSILHNIIKYAIFLLIVGTFYSFLLQLFPDKNINFDVIKHRLTSLNAAQYFDLFYRSIINTLENKRQFSHMWFLYSLLKIYLFLPIFKAFFEKDDRNIYIVFVLMVISRYILPFIDKICGISIFDYFVIDYEFLYIVLGGILCQNFKKLNNNKICIFSILVFVLINIYYIVKSMRFSHNYDNIIIFIMASAVFIAFMHIDVYNRCIDILQSNTFEVYLFHPLFLQVLIRTFKLKTLNVLYPLYLAIIYMGIFVACFYVKKLIMTICKKSKR